MGINRLNNCARRENKKRRLSYRSQQLKYSLESGPVELATLRQLLKQELQENKTTPKEDSHTLIERVQAYSTLLVIRLLNVLSR